tara:strand:- start:9578 stop:10063 length:486 start_codon:yes stop_codon:yes gene_type:complete
MEALFQLTKNISGLKQGPILFKTMSTNPVLKDLVIKLNTEIQMREEHVDSNNQPLYSNRHESSVYSKTTEILSGGRKKMGTPYTLDDTGEFYKSFDIILDDSGFTINADPIKLGDSFGETNLFEEYGIDILGLNEDNMNKFINVLLANIKKTIQIQIYKGI